MEKIDIKSLQLDQLKEYIVSLGAKAFVAGQIYSWLHEKNVDTFDEMTKLLEYFGFEKCNKGKTSGSRVIFKKEGAQPIMLHKPHPGNIVKSYAIKQVYDYLTEFGLLK